MNKGLKYSIILHIIFIVSSFIYISKNSNISSTERIITVDLVNIKPGTSTNLKNSPIRQKNKKIKAKTSNIQKNTIRNKAVKISTKKKSTTDVYNTKKISDQRKLDKKVETLLDNIEKNFTNTDTPELVNDNLSKKVNLATSDKPYDKSLPLSIAEQDNIKMQIEKKFFNPIVSDFNSGEIIIKIKLDMEKTGEIKKVMVLNSSSYNAKHSDAFIALRDSLIRAAYMASPIYGLDTNSYEGKNGWKEIELIFDAYYLMNT